MFNFLLYTLTSVSISDFVFLNNLNADSNNTCVLLAATSFCFFVILSEFSQYDLHIASAATLQTTDNATSEMYSFGLFFLQDLGEFIRYLDSSGNKCFIFRRNILFLSFQVTFSP